VVGSIGLEKISVDEMIKEFDISLWEEDMAKASAMRHKPGNMEPASPPQANRLK